MQDWDRIREKIYGLDILEIGGPTELFNKDGHLFLYDIIGSIDGTNIKDDNIFQKDLRTHFCTPEKNGIQYFWDVSQRAPEELIGKYSIVISSHVLEHIANPIQALCNIRSVLRPGGIVVTIVPFKDYCFDHNREFTPANHMEEDYRNETKEDDTSHIEEIVRGKSYPKHMLDYQQLLSRNNQVRLAHHHCFNLDTLCSVHISAGFTSLYCFQHPEHRLHIIFMGVVSV